MQLHVHSIIVPITYSVYRLLTRFHTLLSAPPFTTYTYILQTTLILASLPGLHALYSQEVSSTAALVHGTVTEVGGFGALGLPLLRCESI